MIKGLIMASGLITFRILFGKNAKIKSHSIVLAFSMLNLLWITALLVSIFGGEEISLQIVSIIVSIAYPLILTILGIKNRKKSKANNERKEDSVGELKN